MDVHRDISIRDRVIGYSAWKSSRMWAAPANDSSLERIVATIINLLYIREVHFKLEEKCSFGASCLINASALTFATLRALTRSVYQRWSTRDHRFSLFLSLFVLAVEGRMEQIVIRPGACTNSYLLHWNWISLDNRSSFEKVNERSKGIFQTSQGDFRPSQNTDKGSLLLFYDLRQHQL